MSVRKMEHEEVRNPFRPAKKKIIIKSPSTRTIPPPWTEEEIFLSTNVYAMYEKSQKRHTKEQLVSRFFLSSLMT